MPDAAQAIIRPCLSLSQEESEPLLLTSMFTHFDTSSEGSLSLVFHSYT